MTGLDVDAIEGSLGESARATLVALDVFAQIESTNSYLMQQEAPAPGCSHVALTDNQTRGRGRHGRTWVSPPGSGLCVSVAHTFSSQPEDLSALTLAVGLGIADVLEEFGASEVQLKWPNDLIVGDGKLGGILTETKAQGAPSITVISGVGLNLDFGTEPDFGAGTASMQRAVDFASFAATLPDRDLLAARVIDSLCTTFVHFAHKGFSTYAERWSERDWLRGRALSVETPHSSVEGVGAGIAEDGTLLVQTRDGNLERIGSGTISMVGEREDCR